MTEQTVAPEPAQSNPQVTGIPPWVYVAALTIGALLFRITAERRRALST